MMELKICEKFKDNVEGYQIILNVKFSNCPHIDLPIEMQTIPVEAKDVAISAISDLRKLSGLEKNLDAFDILDPIMGWPSIDAVPGYIDFLYVLYHDGKGGRYAVEVES